MYAYEYSIGRQHLKTVTYRVYLNILAGRPDAGVFRSSRDEFKLRPYSTYVTTVGSSTPDDNMDDTFTPHKEGTTEHTAHATPTT